MGHDIPGEYLPALLIVQPIGIDQQIDTKFLVPANQIDGF